MGITKSQLLVLDYIKRFIAEKGYSPTIREIMNGLGGKSPSTVHTHLKNLANAGLITYSPTKSRTIELLCENEYATDTEIVRLPLVSLKVRSEFVSIPSFMIEGQNKDDLCVYKNRDTVYIINRNLDIAEDKPTLYLDEDRFVLSNSGKGDFIGVAIAKFELL